MLRLASHEPPPAELSQVIIDAIHEASPPYPNAVRRGVIHPLSVEWVRRPKLVTNPRTGKLIEMSNSPRRETSSSRRSTQNDSAAPIC